MSTLLRLGSAAVFSSLIMVVPAVAAGAGGQFFSPMQDASAYLFHSSQGYLGVTIRDVDNDQVAPLKLKDARGAQIVTIDHDAPAGKSGLKVNDVILQMNGQTVEGIEQLRRMLHETPSGRTITLVVSRDGTLINVSLQLADRVTIGRTAWDGHTPVPQPIPSMSAFDSPGGGTPGGLGGMFVGHSSAMYVGAVVNPVTPQLAGYFGVKSGVGLLIANVENKSPAAAAGLKAGDVVMKINQDSVATRADWERLLRQSADKPVQLTVVREKKEMTLTLQPGTKKDKKKSDLNWPAMSPSKEEINALVASAQAYASPCIDPRALQDEVRKSMRGIDTEAMRLEMEDMRRGMTDMFPPDAFDVAPLVSEPPTAPMD